MGRLVPRLFYLRPFVGLAAVTCVTTGLLVATALADGFLRNGKRSTLPPPADSPAISPATQRSSERAPALATDPSPRTNPAAERVPAPMPAAGGLPPAVLMSLFRRPPPSRPEEPALVELGSQLFRDKRLSADHKLSCASCHVPERGFIDGRATARGKAGRRLPRNTPALWDLGSATAFYWDGRSPTLTAQITDAIERDTEMDSTVAAAVMWLARDPAMVSAFARTRRPLSGDTLLEALAAYQRSLTSPVSRFDRWIAGDANALTQTEVAGFQVFTGPGRCLACHGGWRFTDERYHVIGLPSRDRGRAGVPGTIEAAGRVRAFKTPSLREVRWTAPYMHDGSLKSLSAVINHYAASRPRAPTVAPELRTPIPLSDGEKQALVAFLQAISGDQPPARR